MEIYIQDQAFAHIPAGYSCNNPLPPVQIQQQIKWNRSFNFAAEDYVLFTDRMAKADIVSKRHKKYNLLWLIEPIDVLRHFNNLPDLSMFSRIYTHDRGIIESHNNVAVPITFGGTWINVSDRSVHTKSKLVSMIASNKRSLPGHKLRGSILDIYNSIIDCYGRGSREIGNKITGMKSYMFHVVIENVKRDYFFTEKLIDCFLTGCVPIYWGCPSIGKFFDTRGMLIVDNIRDVHKCLNNITFNMYKQMLPFIIKNYHRANSFLTTETGIYNDIKRRS